MHTVCIPLVLPSLYVKYRVLSVTAAEKEDLSKGKEEVEMEKRKRRRGNGLTYKPLKKSSLAVGGACACMNAHFVPGGLLWFLPFFPIKKKKEWMVSRRMLHWASFFLTSSAWLDDTRARAWSRFKSLLSLSLDIFPTPSTHTYAYVYTDIYLDLLIDGFFLALWIHLCICIHRHMCIYVHVRTERERGSLGLSFIPMQRCYGGLGLSFLCLSRDFWSLLFSILSASLRTSSTSNRFKDLSHGQDLIPSEEIDDLQSAKEVGRLASCCFSSPAVGSEGAQHTSTSAICRERMDVIFDRQSQIRDKQAEVVTLKSQS